LAADISSSGGSSETAPSPTTIMATTSSDDHESDLAADGLLGKTLPFGAPPSVALSRGPTTSGNEDIGEDSSGQGVLYGTCNSIFGGVDDEPNNTMHQLQLRAACTRVALLGMPPPSGDTQVPDEAVILPQRSRSSRFWGACKATVSWVATAAVYLLVLAAYVHIFRSCFEPALRGTWVASQGSVAWDMFTALISRASSVSEPAPLPTVPSSAGGFGFSQFVESLQQHRAVFRHLTLRFMPVTTVA